MSISKLAKLTIIVCSVLTVMAASPSFVGAVDNSGLIAAWYMEEGSGNTAYDASPNERNGTITDATWDDGICGKALFFNGYLYGPQYDHILVEDSPSVYTNLEALTISAWIKYLPKVGSPPSREIRWMIVSKYWDTGDASFGLFINGFNQLCLGVQSINNADWLGRQTQTTLNYGQWYHVTGVYDQIDPEKIILYIDGQRQNTSIYTEGGTVGTLNTHDQPLQIGRYRAGNPWFFSGWIDEVVIYDRALTSEEIAARHDTGPSCPSQFGCAGFESPLDKGPVTVKKNRALPHKAQLQDEEGYAVTGADIATAPVIQVLYESTPGADPEDVTDEALSAGMGTDGNQFVWTADEKWQFNLKTSNYTAPGTYTVTMQSGDDWEYVIDPTCDAQFVIK